ncbi:hypothetical protein [Microbulbifer rhizosphaerae]|uniref:Uncharacterized protein n=1 Tax=Microbulbifer rhizosphaerae TaxID=1562603 RepID=A0A7W4WE42_9GAMM|nr:hypothetical protein [Microbulbifer rhizosphaerae]
MADTDHRDTRSAGGAEGSPGGQGSDGADQEGRGQEQLRAHQRQAIVDDTGHYAAQYPTADQRAHGDQHQHSFHAAVYTVDQALLQYRIAVTEAQAQGDGDKPGGEQRQLDRQRQQV